MRGLILFLLISNCVFFVSAQKWTDAQIEKANTAKNVDYLSAIEKEAVMYINLARLYPKAFAKNEVEGYYGTEIYGDYLRDSKYRLSLIEHLNSMSPTDALEFDDSMYELAECFAKEQGDKGTTGHDREACTGGYYAECCSYGMNTGKDIAMQWLIDDDVPSLGHREICLSSAYTKIGLSHYTHKKWSWCCVADLK